MPFQPGNTVNPGGRPKDKPWADALRTALFREDRKELRAIAEICIAQAKRGEMAAIREIGDRLDGKPVQQVDGPGPEGAHVVRWLRDDEPDPV